MPFLTDIAILDATGAAAVLVEAKSKSGTTPDWAAAMRRNLAAHGLMPNAKFFVLATPDRVYFWMDKTIDPRAVPPDFSFRPERALQPYYEEVGLRPDELAETSFELLLASWLSELMSGGAEDRLPDEAVSWLRDSGFLTAIRGGRLEQR
jgi:hypothetical protein